MRNTLKVSFEKKTCFFNITAPTYLNDLLHSSKYTLHKMSEQNTYICTPIGCFSSQVAACLLSSVTITYFSRKKNPHTTHQAKLFRVAYKEKRERFSQRAPNSLLFSTRSTICKQYFSPPISTDLMVKEMPLGYAKLNV